MERGYFSGLPILFYGVPGLLVIVGLAWVCLVVIRRLNATWFDAGWRAARLPNRRREIAWEQWDDEMRMRTKLDESDSPPASPDNTFRP